MYDSPWKVAASVAIIMAFLAGATAGNSAAERRWRAHMIQIGLAEYDRQTGKWQWVDPAMAMPGEAGEVDVEK